MGDVRHGGVDVHSLLRAMWVNFRAHHVMQGGSTITQQTAKIVFLNPKRTYARKLEELFDAEGRYLYASPSYARVLGVAPDDLIGRRSPELIHPEELQLVQTSFLRALAGERVSIVARLRRHACL